MRFHRVGVVAAVAAAAGIVCWGGQERGRFAIFATAEAAAARAEPQSMSNSDRVNFRAFHDHLAPYGTWLNHGRWGSVWRPNAGRGFRPYRDGGHWDDTSEYGTVWVSDYGWGDVPFHYGRWVYDRTDGWIWVPGYVWGPGWVVWRAGAGNIGWLPMPPWLNYDGYGAFPDDWIDGYGYADDGFSENAFDALWSFVDADDLFAPNIGYYVIGPGYYHGFIGRTTDWTRFSIYNGHVFNRSIDRDRFRATFGHDLRPGKRHDFEGRMGPIVDYASGRQIQARERGAVHALPTVQPGSHMHYDVGAHVTAPTYRSHSVNVYRGGSAGTGIVSHTVATAHHTHSATTTHATVVHHSMAVHHGSPEYHPLPSHRPAAAPSRGGAPSHGAPPNGERPH